MQKGKMRGQGFMNFKDTDKAVEIFDALNGIVIGQKAIKLEFSASKRFNSKGIATPQTNLIKSNEV